MRIAKKEEATSIAKNLIKVDVPVDKIVAATGLTRTKIENLRSAD